jgi:hypothetical protein
MYAEGSCPFPLRPLDRFHSTRFCGFVMQRHSELYDAIFKMLSPGEVAFASAEEHGAAINDLTRSIFSAINAAT